MQSVPATRRSVLHAAAWTVPLVTLASAAPAYAASTAVECAVTHTFDFEPFLSPNAPGHPAPIVHEGGTSMTEASWSVASTPSLSGAPLQPGTTLASSTMTVRTVMSEGRLRQSNSMNGDTPNGHFRFSSLGQTTQIAGNDARAIMRASGPALKFATDTLDPNSTTAPRMVITLTFDTPIKALSFLLTDIDSNGSSQVDRIQIAAVLHGTTAVPFTVTYPSGTAAYGPRPDSPTTSTQWSGTSSVTDPQTGGNMLVTTPSTQLVDQVQIIFENIAQSSGQRNNSINLANVSYQSDQKVCIPAN